jgi:hypothetical protein
MKKMITTSNTKINLKREGVKEVVKDDPIHGKVTVLESTKKLTTVTTGKVRPRTRLKGQAKKNYYGPLLSNDFKSFPETAKDRRTRERVREERADKKRVADGVSPVLSKRGTRKANK